jgi:hypothetical protein
VDPEVLMSFENASAVSLVLASVVVSATAALAQEEPRKVGIGLTAGAGVTSFSNSETNDAVSAGGIWEARIAFGTRPPVGLEAAYIGSAQPMSALSGRATLIGTGLEAVARVDLGTLAVQPYAVGGIGWTHYGVSGSGDTELRIGSDDDIFTIPAGLGVRYRSGPWLFDGRGTYRFAFDDELLQRQGDLESFGSLESWAVTFRGGFEF